MKIIRVIYVNMLVLFFFFTASLMSCDKQKTEQTLKQDKEETVKEVPQPVKQAFDKTYPGAKINEFAKETEDGQVYYEVSCVFEGRKMDISYHPDGSVAAIEEIISVNSLPETVKKAVAKEFKEYTINLVEKVQKKSTIQYELKIEDPEDETRLEVLYSSTGRIVKKSGNSEENEENGEESEDDD